MAHAPIVAAQDGVVQMVVPTIDTDAVMAAAAAADAILWSPVPEEGKVEDGHPHAPT
jgi:hypothetical protein